MENQVKFLSPIDIRNEQLALNKLSILCLTKLREYPMTLRGDRDLLEKGKNLTQIQRNALHITIEEKEVLHSLID